MLPNHIFPNFFIVGAARSGTTSLWRYLTEHPDVFMPKDIRFKEPGYFSNVYKYGVKRLEDYLDLFSLVTTEKMVGEASALYLTSPESPGRIFETVPNAKIIIILRNPVDRAYSLYNWMAKEGYEPINTFQKALDEEQIRVRDTNFIENNPQYYYNYLYFTSGLYSQQVKRYYEIFPQEQILFILFDEFKSSPLKTVKKVFGFLNVAVNYLPNIKIHNSGETVYLASIQYFIKFKLTKYLRRAGVSRGYTGAIAYSLCKLNSRSHKLPPLNRNLRNQLIECYRSDIQETQKITGLDLNDWLVNNTI